MNVPLPMFQPHPFCGNNHIAQSQAQIQLSIAPTLIKQLASFTAASLRHTRFHSEEAVNSDLSREMEGFALQDQADFPAPEGLPRMKLYSDNLRLP